MGWFGHDRQPSPKSGGVLDDPPSIKRPSLATPGFSSRFSTPFPICESRSPHRRWGKEIRKHRPMERSDELVAIPMSSNSPFHMFKNWRPRAAFQAGKQSLCGMRHRHLHHPSLPRLNRHRVNAPGSPDSPHILERHRFSNGSALLCRVSR